MRSSMRAMRRARGPLPLRDGDRAEHRGRADRHPLQPQHPGGGRPPRRDAEVAATPSPSSPSTSAASARRRTSTQLDPGDYGPELCRLIGKVRPELDAYLVTDRSVEDIAGLGPRDLPAGLLQPGRLHGAAPEHPARRPGPLQARPSSPRSRNIPASRPASSTPCRSAAASRSTARTGSRTWAPSTAPTSSWPRPRRPPAASTRSWSRVGPIKEAQELASRAFGSKQTFFATNGTSTCNKIVVQALVRPGRHRPGRPGLPQVAPLRHGAGRRAGRLSGELPAGRILDVRRGADPRDQAQAPEAQGRRQARPGADAAADQLHLRRRRLQRRAGDGGMPRHQAGPRLPLGRGLVRLRPLQPDYRQRTAHERRPGPPLRGCAPRATRKRARRSRRS